MIAAVAGALAGCASGSDPQVGASPYADKFDQALADAQSDYVRGVLADGDITAEEFTDARQRVEDCLRSAGVGGWYMTNSWGRVNLEYSGELADTKREALSTCENQWMGPIHYLYEEILINPTNESWDDVMARCLVRKGLVPEGFSGHDWSEIESQLAGEPVVLDDVPFGEQTVPEPTSTPTLPGGLPADDKQVVDCMTNPQL